MAEKKNRIVYTFDVPEEFQAGEFMDGRLESIGVRKLLIEEEKMANARAPEGIGKAEEVVKASLVEATIDGETKKLATGDGSTDSFWKGLDPQQRSLVATAYADVNILKDEAAKSFLATKRVRAS